MRIYTVHKEKENKRRKGKKEQKKRKNGEGRKSEKALRAQAEKKNERAEKEKKEEKQKQGDVIVTWDSDAVCEGEAGVGEVGREGAIVFWLRDEKTEVVLGQRGDGGTSLDLQIEFVG